jgi:hypothetical protein
MAFAQKIETLKQWDRNQADFLGKHWLVLGTGLLAPRCAHGQPQRRRVPQ